MKNEAKLTKNDQASSQYASTKVYQNKRESQQPLKTDRFAD